MSIYKSFPDPSAHARRASQVGVGNLFRVEHLQERLKLTHVCVCLKHSRHSRSTTHGPPARVMVWAAKSFLDGASRCQPGTYTLCIVLRAPAIDCECPRPAAARAAAFGFWRKGVEVVVLIFDFSGLAMFRGCSAFGDHPFCGAVRDNFHDLYNANFQCFKR